ncbi:NADPH-dependent FMN reductase [Nitrosococcus halophilus Nc 4]|uniref:NADPH-dependent FMN reductase n=1 Tax=Nitrosococcus halophilus (strain Nc4) TaxID=472759 RepID=D5BZC0_NITHN|nr:NADPH-dependent FMN reductase [Nitrosococcus halophilus]ADE16134.1 NADPH-dependent FMN reductase [Nitrosococcus halophilus Nc 4]
MARIIGISGSLRRGSLNALLLNAAVQAAPEGVFIAVASIRGIPLYDGDLEASEGVPRAVVALKDKIAAADALLLVTPEYNHSLPGVFKNAIDWLSRPPGDISRVFRGKPVTLMGATPGGMGTAYSQTAWLPVFRALGMRPWFGRSLNVSQAHTVFDDSGALSDGQLRERLQAFVKEYAAFVAAQ